MDKASTLNYENPSIARTWNIKIGKKSLYALFPIFFLTLIIGFRMLGESRDLVQYIEFFDEIGGGETSRYEFAFVYLAKFIQSIFGREAWDNYGAYSTSLNIFFLTVALISVSIKTSLLVYKKHFLILLAIYILLIIPLHEMTQIRVGLGTAFAFLGLYRATYTETKFFSRVVFVILAAGFHQSILIMAPFMLWPNFAKQRSLLFVFFIVISMALSLGALAYLSTIFTEELYLIEYYTREDTVLELNSPNPFSSRMIILVSILMLGLWNLQHLPDESLPLFYVSAIGVGIWYGMMAIPTMAHRFLELTLFGYLLWVPELPRNPRLISLALLFLLAIWSFYKTFFLSTMFGNELCAPACLQW